MYDEREKFYFENKEKSVHIYSLAVNSKKFALSEDRIDVRIAI